MGRIPKQDDAPTYRRTTIRRTTEESADPVNTTAAPTADGSLTQPTAVTLKPAQTASASAPAPVPAPAPPPTPAPAPAPAAKTVAAVTVAAVTVAAVTVTAVAAAPVNPAADRPSLDGDALLAEIDGFDQDAFAALLAAGSPIDFESGDQVSGTIARVTPDTIFIDIGGKSEAWLARAELDESSDAEEPAVGQEISAIVLSAGGQGVRLTRHLSGAAGVEALETAMEAGVPVDGRIDSRNQGGFVVAMGAVRAFCPVSHIDRFPEADLDAYLGRTLPFRILEMRGRDVVVSHKVIAAEQAEEDAKELWKTLRPGDQRDGIVTGEKPYGVFVDIGGITGLVHKSELGWGDDSVAPTRGQRVQVRIIELNVQAGRISLSMKDEAMGPWTRVGTDIVVGSVYTGTVTRLADFGAFVELLPGLQGLAHISTLADRRIDHPSDVLEVGQQLAVRVLSVDRERERLELGVKQAADGWSGEARSGRTSRGGAARRSAASSDTGSLGTLADLLGGLKLKG